MRLQQYTETLDFHRLPSGHRVLLPSAVDLAIKRMLVAHQEAELQRVTDEEEPGDIAKLRVILETAEATEETDTERYRQAVARTMAYDHQKAQEILVWQRSVARSLKALEEAEKSGQVAGGSMEHLRYEMREFSFQDRQELDEKHSEAQTVDESAGPQKFILVNPRNAELLHKVLLGEWVPEGEAVDDGKLEQVAGWKPRKFGDETYVLCEVPCNSMTFGEGEDPVQVPELQDKVFQTLVDRMWVRNTMAPELAGFFAQRQPH